MALYLTDPSLVLSAGVLAVAFTRMPVDHCGLTTSLRWITTLQAKTVRRVRVILQHAPQAEVEHDLWAKLCLAENDLRLSNNNPHSVCVRLRTSIVGPENLRQFCVGHGEEPQAAPHNPIPSSPSPQHHANQDYYP